MLSWIVLELSTDNVLLQDLRHSNLQSQGHSFGSARKRGNILGKKAQFEVRYFTIGVGRGSRVS